MTAKFEKTSTNEGTLTFELPIEAVNTALDSAFKKARKNINVPGFRKGKVPRQIFNNLYGEEALYDDVLNALIPSAYAEALEEVEVDAVGQPKFDIESLEKGKPWVIKAQVQTKPAVKLGDYKGLTVEKQDRELTDDEVNQYIETRRESLAELVVKEDAAESGDTVVIDYEGFVDEVAFDGGKDENYSLELGSGQFIPGFENQLIGAKPGEDVEVKVTFPEQYHAEDLAGKEAIFKVKVHEVKTKQLPELDDEFAKDIDDEVESFKEWEEKVRQELQESKEEAAKEVVEDLALRQAVENAEIDGGIPQAMIDEEINRQVEYFLNNLSRQGINPEMYYQITGSTEEDLRNQFAEEAELRTKTNLVLEEIVNVEELDVNEDEINEEIESLAAQYGMETSKVRQFVTEEMLSNDIKMKKAMNLIIDSVEEK